jgi:hypothetical protein
MLMARFLGGSLCVIRGSQMEKSMRKSWCCQQGTVDLSLSPDGGMMKKMTLTITRNAQGPEVSLEKFLAGSMGRTNLEIEWQRARGVVGLLENHLVVEELDLIRPHCLHLSKSCRLVTQ